MAFAAEIVSARIIKSKEKILIGDPVKMEITIRHFQNEDYKLKLDPKGLGFFEFRGEAVVERQNIDASRVESKISIEIVPFSTGKLPIAPLLFSNGRDELLSTPFEVEVSAVTSPEERTIKDVRLMPQAPSDKWLQPAVLTMLLASSFIYLFLRTADRFGRQFFVPKQTLKEVAIVSNFEDEAIKRLKKLLAEISKLDNKVFHIEFAQIVTNYLIKRYGFINQELTTVEMMLLLEKRKVPVLVCATVAEVLDWCDLVKFAQHKPDVARTDLLVRKTIDLITALNFKDPEKERLQ